MNTRLIIAAVSALIAYLFMTFLPWNCKVARFLSPLGELPARCAVISN